MHPVLSEEAGHVHSLMTYYYMYDYVMKDMAPEISIIIMRSFIINTSERRVCFIIIKTTQSMWQS